MIVLYKLISYFNIFLTYQLYYIHQFKKNLFIIWLDSLTNFKNEVIKITFLILKRENVMSHSFWVTRFFFFRNFFSLKKIFDHVLNVNSTYLINLASICYWEKGKNQVHSKKIYWHYFVSNYELWLVSQNSKNVYIIYNNHILLLIMI